MVRAESAAPRPIMPFCICCFVCCQGFRGLGLGICYQCMWYWQGTKWSTKCGTGRALSGLQNVCGFRHVAVKQPCKAFESSNIHLFLQVVRWLCCLHCIAQAAAASLTTWRMSLPAPLRCLARCNIELRVIANCSCSCQRVLGACR